MPADLVAKIKKAANFNQGYKLTELVAAAELDMQWHTLPAGAAPQQPDAFEKQALEKTHVLLSAVPPRYRSSYFSHIWGSGYSAGYYAYLWSEMLDDDAYQWFEEHGGLTRANGDRFRQIGIVARQHGGPGKDVCRLARQRPERRANDEVPRVARVRALKRRPPARPAKQPCIARRVCSHGNASLGGVTSQLPINEEIGNWPADRKILLTLHSSLKLVYLAGKSVELPRCGGLSAAFFYFVSGIALSR